MCGAAGASVTCTAPPPINAPPQVQAHNFAKAIRTDIVLTLFRFGTITLAQSNLLIGLFVFLTWTKNAEESLNNNCINLD
jgi:hypothetical protein